MPQEGLTGEFQKQTNLAVKNTHTKRNKHQAHEFSSINRLTNSDDFHQKESNGHLDNNSNTLQGLDISQSFQKSSETSPQKVSRAARRREKRAALQKVQEEAALKVQSSTVRSVELQKLEEQLQPRNLCVFSVPSDGDCLYQSVIHQLKIRSYPISSLVDLTESDFFRNNDQINLTYTSTSDLVKLLRWLTAKHIREHVDEFLPFLFNPETGEPMTTDEFQTYCDHIEKTSVWGGQIEIRALSNILKLPIEVIQAEGVPLLIGEEFTGPPITIIYHRHAFALGEHYNSCIPMNKNSSG